MKKAAVVFLVFFLILIHGFTSSYPLLDHPETRESLFQAFESLLIDAKAEWQIPGMAVGVIYQGETVYQKTFGVKDLETQDPVDIYTLFQIGSTTKAFTAALLATFVDEGAVQWKDRVLDHYPEFAFQDLHARELFLLEDLMAQHSGLYPYAGDELAFWRYDRAKILESLAYLPSIYSFRNGFSYVNNLFVVVEEIMMRLSGKTYAQLLDERLFGPLHMHHSHGTLKGFLESENHTTTHQFSHQGPIPIDPNSGFIEWVNPVFPAGGIASNIPDMLRWIEMQLNLGSFEGQQIISSSQIQYMHTPKTIISGSAWNPIEAYCLSWVFEEFEGQKLLWHNGDTIACRTFIVMVPQAELGIVILSNVGGQGLPDLLGKSLIKLALGKEPLDLTLKAPSAVDEQDDSTVHYPSLPLEAYAGTFAHPMFGRMVLSVQPPYLVGVASEAVHPFTFEHITRDMFYVHLSPFFEKALAASFFVNQEGMVNEFLLYTGGNPDGYIFMRVCEE